MSWALIVQRILLDFFLHLAFFPIWWYGPGAKKVLLGCGHFIEHGNRQFAPGLWAKNLFVPMFGQQDWQGRIMSFFMRLVNIIFRSLFLFVWSLVGLVFFGIWIAIPVIITFRFFLSLSAVLST